MVSVHGASKEEVDKFVYAGGYYLESVKLYPHKQSPENPEHGIEIKRIINHVHIDESIYAMGLICTIQIADGINIMERYRLSGNEKLKIIIKRKDPFQELTRIELDFIATEYPLYTRAMNKKSQAYEVKFISPHIYQGSLKSLCRSVSGSPIDIIYNILTNDLGYDESKITKDGNVNNLYKYLIPNIKPINAIRNVMINSVDNSISPIIVWETMLGLNIKGLSTVFNSDVYKGRTYYMRAGRNLRDDGDTMFIDQLTTILELSSDLKMSKIDEANDGAYASSLNHYDVSSKTFKQSVFSYNTSSDNITKLSDFHSFSESFLIDDKSLADHHGACTYDLTTVNGSSNNSMLGDTVPNTILTREAMLAHQDFMTHDIKLYGDLEFTSGSIIDVSLPNGDVDSVERDTHFSGKYLVTSISHKFENEYTMNVKIKKDGLLENINIDDDFPN